MCTNTHTLTYSFLVFSLLNMYTFRYLYIVFNVCYINYIMYISSDIYILHSKYAKVMGKQYL